MWSTQVAYSSAWTVSKILFLSTAVSMLAYFSPGLQCFPLLGSIITILQTESGFWDEDEETLSTEIYQMFSSKSQ